jgi:hypothetical protein
LPVSCRFKEFGIRRALGAGSGRIVNAAVQPAAMVILAGLVAGLALSVGPNKVVFHWSIGNLNDPVVLVAVSLVLCGCDDVRRNSSEPSCLDSAGRRSSARLNVRKDGDLGEPPLKGDHDTYAAEPRAFRQLRVQRMTSPIRTLKAHQRLT